jgi:MFS family permease
MSLAIAQSPATPSRARIIAAVSIGNALEYYDLAIYTFVAVIIGKLIFPAQEPTSQVLLSLGIYGTGYIARPLGGIVIGAIGDRRGRKVAVNLTLFLMAFWHGHDRPGADLSAGRHPGANRRADRAAHPGIFCRR